MHARPETNLGTPALLKKFLENFQAVGQVLLVITRPTSVLFRRRGQSQPSVACLTFRRCDMTEQDLIQAARGVVEAFNASDWEGCKAAMTSDSVYDEAGTSRRLQGVEDIIAALQGWKEAMPDARGTVTNAFASGNTAVLEVTWQGTHTGPLKSPSGTFPASGKQQTTPSAWVFEFDGNKIKESRQYFDMLSFMQQLGLLPQ